MSPDQIHPPYRCTPANPLRCKLQGRSFGRGQQPGFYAVHQAVEELARDVGANLDDEAGDQQAGNGVGPRKARGYADETEENPGRREGVKP